MGVEHDDTLHDCNSPFTHFSVTSRNRFTKVVTNEELPRDANGKKQEKLKTALSLSLRQCGVTPACSWTGNASPWRCDETSAKCEGASHELDLRRVR